MSSHLWIGTIRFNVKLFTLFFNSWTFLQYTCICRDTKKEIASGNEVVASFPTVGLQLLGNELFIIIGKIVSNS